MACEEVASASCVVEFLSVFSRSGTPGRGCVVGKNCACRAACLAVKVERATGSCAQAWKISAACEIGHFLRGGVGEEGSGGERHTSGPGRPCNWALIFQGREGLPYSCRITLLHLV